MVMFLGTLAHNVMVWAKRWLAVPQLQHYGPMRIVRDVFRVSGFLRIDTLGRIRHIVLNRDAPLATMLLCPLQRLLGPVHVVLQVGQT